MPTMTKNTEWTTDLIRTINAEAEEALRAIAERHGMVVKGTKGIVQANMQDALLTFQFTLAEAAEKPKSERDWDAYAEAFGYKKSDFGRKVRARDGKVYTVAGLNPDARKNHLVITDAKGKRFVVGDSDIEAWL